MKARAWTWLVLILLAIGPSWATARTDAPAQATGTITGSIFEADGVTPLPHASVGAFDAVVWGEGLYATASGPDGSYRLEGVAEGAYRIEALADQHGRLFYPGTPFFNQSTPITVQPGQTVSGIDLSLGPGGFISGHVVAADGTPLPAVNVVLADAYSTDLGGCAGCSYGQGEYLVALIPLGFEYKIYAEGMGNWCQDGPQSYEKQWWPDQDQWAQGGILSVTVEQPRLTGIDFRLRPAGSISGHVSWVGSPTPVFPVSHVYVLDASGSELVASTDVAANGTYTVLDLPVGSYLVYAVREGYALQFYHDAGPHLAAATPVEVHAGTNTPDVDFVLEPAGTISGQVLAADGIMPLAGVSVSADGTWLHTCSAADGSYAVGHVPLDLALTYRAAANTWCAASPRYLSEWWQEVGHVGVATPITLTAATPHVGGIVFTLDPLPPAAYLPLICR
jgi:hypothetical protein